MHRTRLALVAVMGMVSAASIATAASANTAWERHHPRQDQVLDRVANQRHEIRKDVRDGDLNHAQAQRLLARDNRVAREDHIIARANGGYITKREQRALNTQENRIHHHIPS